MKRVLLGLLALASLSAEAATIRIGGHDYQTGYLGRQKSLPGGQKKGYWRPSFLEAQDLPDHFDARELGFVAPIKNQGSCGSCWDFSMTKTYESARLSAGKAYLDLAEQDPLVNAPGMYGCDGGFMNADYWVHGLALESDCPYRASDRVGCKKPVADKALAWGFVGAAGRSPTVDELRAALVKYHVISVTVAAGGSDWNGGNGGKMTSCRNRGVNHMVNLVGYDTAGGKTTFIGANSWGTDWGDKGFFYAAQGCNELASEEDGALWISYEETPPEPGTPPVVNLPTDIFNTTGVELMIGTRQAQGVTYHWSSGETDSMIYVNPAADSSYTLTGKSPAGEVSATVKVHVMPKN